MSKTVSNFIKLAPPGTKCDGAHMRYELKGREIKATPSAGTKPAPKDLTLIGLLDAAAVRAERFEGSLGGVHPLTFADHV